MEKRRLGNTGLEVSVLGFGGAEIGFESASLDTVSRLLGSAIDAGLNVIDTAECYKDSESLIGQAVSGRRDEFLLFTKCGHASGFDLPDWNPQMLRQSIDRSLQRLQTDHVDLLQLHTCSKELLFQGDVITVLQEARDAGKTRFIGYSGDGQNALTAIELGVFDTLQTSINLADQEALTLTLPKAHANKMGVIAKRPVANAAWRSRDTPPTNDYARPYWERLRALDYDLLQDGRDPLEIALKFTLAQLGVSVAIVGTQNPERWHQNAEILASGPLDNAEIQAIRDRWTVIAELDWIGLS